MATTQTFEFQSTKGYIISDSIIVINEVKASQAAVCRSACNSFNQETMWFQLGMLWDAKL